MTSLLIGSIPWEGTATLSALDIPFILLVDPVDRPYRIEGKPISIVEVPFKADPLCVLKLPFAESITSVFSFTELGLLPAALLAEALHIATVPVASVLQTRNKLFMRRTLMGKMEQPGFGLVHQSNAQDIPYPVIVKPLDSSGSRGIEYIDDPTTFEQLIGGDLCLWEQYVDGPEFSVEAVTWEGQHQILGITEKITTGAPNFVEVGHRVPAQLSPQAAQEITATVCRCLDLLQVDKGATHTEVKYADSQVMVIETHTRAGGDRIPLLTKLVSGYDQYELAVCSILGRSTPAVGEKKFKCATVQYFRWPEGRIASIDGVEDCQVLPGVIEIEVKVKPGDHMPLFKHSHDRPGFVVVGGDSFAEVEARVAAVEKLIKISYEA
ncbi:MAG TPA: ATP-grasp domain-containing protein [Ktedonobacteraceae bacterium]|nr:ATP-grasp domain-containing protein [Ktedonobacteraceae bacterium]